MLIRYLKRLDAALRMAELRLGRGRNDLAEASLDIAENYLKLLVNSFSDDLYIKDTSNKAFVSYFRHAKAKYAYLVDTCACVERNYTSEKLLEDALNFSESQRQLGLDRYSSPSDIAVTEGLGRYGFLAPKVEESPSTEPREQFSFFGGQGS